MDRTIKQHEKHQRRKNRKLLGSILGTMTPESWNEDTTLAKQFLYLDASSYVPTPIFDLPGAVPDFGNNFIQSPRGGFAYQNRVLPRHRPLKLIDPTDGMVLFSDEVVLPTLIGLDLDSRGQRFRTDASITERVRKGYVWMSLAPMEVLTQRAGVEAACGTVVIGGLGLGWLLRKVSEKDSVERVIVVDTSQELLDWFGNDLCHAHPKVTDVICDDVYNQIGRHGKDAIHLLDIWPTYYGSNFDPRLWNAKRQCDRIWAWGYNQRIARRLESGELPLSFDQTLAV